MTDLQTRVNSTFTGAVRQRMEQWRAAQVEATGRIPDLAETVRILVHKGLAAEGFEATQQGRPE